MRTKQTRTAKSATLTSCPRLSEDETERMARQIVRRLSLPLGTTKRDAIQEAMTRITERSDAGYSGRFLFVRVWGDMKDLYGRAWRRFYQAGEQSYSDSIEDGLPSPGRVTHDVEAGLQNDVREAVQKLKPSQRAVVEQIIFRNLTHKEAAKELGLSKQAVTMRYARARARLADLLRAYA